ncbi:MAG: hypothetical protein ACI9UU_002623, partial [Candidatus Azotimanducaceae bacterium]
MVQTSAPAPNAKQPSELGAFALAPDHAIAIPSTPMT